jgi:hypothetical protein
MLLALQVITNAAAAASLSKVLAAKAGNAAAAKSGPRTAAAGSGNRGGQASGNCNGNRAGVAAPKNRNQQARWRRESAAAANPEVTTPVTAALTTAAPAAVVNTNTAAVTGTAVANKTAAVAPSTDTIATPTVVQSNSSAAASNTTAKPKAKIHRISCFVSMPRSSSSKKPVSVMQRMYRRTASGIDMCGRYQLRCSENRKAACTDAEVKSGAWIWEYRPLSAAVCSEMKSIAALGVDSGFKNVMCCRGSGCNKPDRTVDRFTKVVQRPVRTARARKAGANAAAAPAAAAPAAATPAAAAPAAVIAMPAGNSTSA